MSNLICITGVTGSGKDTVAKALLYLAASNKYSNSLKSFEECSFEEAAFSNLGWEVKRFAGPLKNFVAEVLGVTRRQLEDRTFKESTLGDEWGNHTPRSIMQLVGTEVGRTIHPNFHVNALFSKYIPIDIIPGHNYRDNGRGELIDEDDFEYMYPSWIIPDCRFDNEAKTIKERGGIVIRVNRDMPNTNSHASNAGVSNEYVDYELYNNGTIEDLINQVKKLNLI